MLVFTNRQLDTSSSDATALTKRYVSFSDVLNSVQVTERSKSWKVSDPREELSDADAMAQLNEVLAGSKPVLLFLHGNNNTPADCFTRCQWLEEQYNVAVIGYSWASEGCLPDGSDLSGPKEPDTKFTDPDEGLAAVETKASLQVGWIALKAQRYAQAKVNAKQGKEAFARLLRLVAAARLGGMRQKVSLAAHSLGCHLLHYTIDEQDAEASLSAMHNVALIAGCTDATKHSAWVGQIHPLLRVYITYTKADSVLNAAKLVENGGDKLGANPGNDRLVGPKYRYINFEAAKVKKWGAHRYFVADPGKKLTKPSKLLFSRIFASEVDFTGGIDERKKVYPMDCSADGSVCHMGNIWLKSERR